MIVVNTERFALQANGTSSVLSREKVIVVVGD
jgi:hypothetical protein